MKKFAQILTIFFISLFLNGCLDYEQITNLKIDGSGDMYIHYWMKANNITDSTIIEKVGIFNPDSIKNEYSSQHLNITNIEVYRDDNDSTIHAKVMFTFNRIDSLNYTKKFKDMNFVFKSIDKNVMLFSQYVPPFATGFGIKGQEFKIIYTYYIPGEIFTHNANERSNNKLTWAFTLEEIGTGKTISATFRPFKLKETPVVIYYAALFVIVVVVFYLLKKKK